MSRMSWFIINDWLTSMLRFMISWTSLCTGSCSFKKWKIALPLPQRRKQTSSAEASLLRTIQYETNNTRLNNNKNGRTHWHQNEAQVKGCWKAKPLHWQNLFKRCKILEVCQYNVSTSLPVHLIVYSDEWQLSRVKTLKNHFDLYSFLFSGWIYWRHCVRVVNDQVFFSPSAIIVIM